MPNKFDYVLMILHLEESFIGITGETIGKITAPEAIKQLSEAIKLLTKEGRNSG